MLQQQLAEASTADGGAPSEMDGRAPPAPSSGRRAVRNDLLSTQGTASPVARASVVDHEGSDSEICLEHWRKRDRSGRLEGAPSRGNDTVHGPGARPDQRARARHQHACLQHARERMVARGRCCLVGEDGNRGGKRACALAARQRPWRQQASLASKRPWLEQGCKRKLLQQRHQHNHQHRQPSQQPNASEQPQPQLQLQQKQKQSSAPQQQTQTSARLKPSKAERAENPPSPKESTGQRQEVEQLAQPLMLRRASSSGVSTSGAPRRSQSFDDFEHMRCAPRLAAEDGDS